MMIRSSEAGSKKSKISISAKRLGTGAATAAHERRVERCSAAPRRQAIHGLVTISLIQMVPRAISDQAGSVEILFCAPAQLQLGRKIRALDQCARRASVVLVKFRRCRPSSLARELFERSRRSDPNRSASGVHVGAHPARPITTIPARARRYAVA